MRTLHNVHYLGCNLCYYSDNDSLVYLQEDAANASPVVTTPSTELATKENDNDKQPATAVVVGDESPTKIHKETGVSDLSEVMTTTS